MCLGCLRTWRPSPPMTWTVDDSLIDNLGFTRLSLLDFAFAINKDEYFKPLSVALIPDDVADCVTVGELIELVQNEFSGELPERRRRMAKQVADSAD